MVQLSHFKTLCTIWDKHDKNGTTVIFSAHMPDKHNAFKNHSIHRGSTSHLQSDANKYLCLA